MSALREQGAVSRGMARGLRRYQCKGCGRTFNALTGTPLSGLHHKERWLSFGASLAKGETVKASAARCDVAVSTAFRWRHRFLAAARSDSEVLKGIVEADATSSRSLGCARAGTQGTAAGLARRRSAASRASRCRFSWRRTERDDGQRGAAQGRCGGAHGALDPVSRRTPCSSPDGGFRLVTLRRRARAVSHETLRRGTGSGRSACAGCAATVGSSKASFPARDQHRPPALSGQLQAELVPPRRPRPRRQMTG